MLIHLFTKESFCNAKSLRPMLLLVTISITAPARAEAGTESAPTPSAPTSIVSSATSEKGLDYLLRGGIMADDDSVLTVLGYMSIRCGVAMIFSGKVVEVLKFNYAQDVSVRTVLNEVLPQYNLAYEVDETGLIVKIGYDWEMKQEKSSQITSPIEPAEQLSNETTGLDTVIKGGITATDTDISDICSQLSRISGWNFIKTGSVKGKVSFRFRHDLTVRQLLNNVLPQYGWGLIEREQYNPRDRKDLGKAIMLNRAGQIDSYYAICVPAYLLRLCAEPLLFHQSHDMAVVNNRELAFSISQENVMKLKYRLRTLDFTLGYGIASVIGACLGYLLAKISRRLRVAWLLRRAA